VSPPTVYGRGRGPANTRSVQVPTLTNLVLTKNVVPTIGEGKARWNVVHVADLADLFVLLTETALSGKTNDSSELWGEKGYYLAENGEVLWKELARSIGDKAQELGFVEKLEEKAVQKEDAIALAGLVAFSWGLNSRGKSSRAKNLLGWKPRRIIEEEIEALLKDEKARLG
jgi:nucleoside-diphosphate-sugar epimerase